jgi:hypothetical protein
MDFGGIIWGGLLGCLELTTFKKLSILDMQGYVACRGTVHPCPGHFAVIGRSATARDCPYGICHWLFAFQFLFAEIF